MTWKTAKYAGRCTTCGGAVMQGDRINLARGMGGGVVCPSCRGREGAADRATDKPPGWTDAKNWPDRGGFIDPSGPPNEAPKFDRATGCPKCEYTHPGAACTADGCPGRATGSISDRIRAAERATGSIERFGRPGPRVGVPPRTPQTESEREAADDRALFQSMEMDGLI